MTKKTHFFDLDTVTQEKNYAHKGKITSVYIWTGLKDRVKEAYYRGLRRRDFSYMEKGVI